MSIRYTPEEITEILNDYFSGITHKQYIGARYVPIFGRKGEDSIEWDNTAPYEPLTIVLHQGNSYTSRQFVPTGIDINNELYWAQTGNYNAQVEIYRREVLSFNDRITANEEKVNEFDIDNNSGFLMDEIRSFPHYQYKTMTDKTTQSAVQINNNVYVFQVNSNNEIDMITLNLVDDVAYYKALTLVGHANTACAYDNNIILSHNQTSAVAYMISQTGNLVREITVNQADEDIVYDNDANKFYGLSASTDQIFIYDTNFNLIDTVTFDFGFMTVREMGDNWALGNCACKDGIIYLAYRPNSMYMVNTSNFAVINGAILPHTSTSEFEGILFINDKLHSINHQFTERVMTINELTARGYYPIFRGYNGEFREISEYQINALAITTPLHVDYNADDIFCDGTSDHPFCSLSQISEVFTNTNKVAVYINGTAESLANISMNGVLELRSGDQNNRPTLNGVKLNGVGSVLITGVDITVDNGTALEIVSGANITCELINCHITSTNGDGIVANWHSVVEVRGTCTIDAGSNAISATNAKIAIDNIASVNSGNVSNQRNAVFKVKDILNSNTNADFTTKIPLTAFANIVGLIKTKVSGYNFYIPYSGFVDRNENKVYASGSRWASVVNENVIATFEGTINGNSVTKDPGDSDTVLYSIWPIS